MPFRSCDSGTCHELTYCGLVWSDTVTVTVALSLAFRSPLRVIVTGSLMDGPVLPALAFHVPVPVASVYVYDDHVMPLTSLFAPM